MASAFILRWSASSGSTRTACWPSSTAAATTIRACRISRRWGSGTPACPTAASRSDGSGRLADERYDAVDAQRDREPRQLAVARGAEPAAFAARVRRSGALPPRRHRRREAGARRAEPAASRRRTRRSSSSPRRPQNADRELGLRAPGVGELSHAGGLRGRRRPRRQPPAGRGAHRRRNADAPVLRHLLGQLVRHARAAGRSPQPAADVHRRRGARLHGRPQAHRPRPTRSR